VSNRVRCRICGMVLESKPVHRMKRLRHIHSRLIRLYGHRFHGVVLHGSEARGDPRPDSDIDVLVLLGGPVESGRELERIIEALYDLEEEWDCRPIHAIPTDVADYEAGRTAYLRAARAEGVVCRG